MQFIQPGCPKRRTFHHPTTCSSVLQQGNTSRCNSLQLPITLFIRQEKAQTTYTRSVVTQAARLIQSSLTRFYSQAERREVFLPSIRKARPETPAVTSATSRPPPAVARTTKPIPPMSKYSALTTGLRSRSVAGKKRRSSWSDS